MNEEEQPRGGPRMRVYIAGPMTNMPLENFPAFDAAAERFRAAGWDVHNPAEISRAHRAANPDRDIPTNGYRDFIPLDIAAIATCDAVALLPGWEQSRGVRFELHAAELFGCAVLDAETMAARA